MRMPAVCLDLSVQIRDLYTGTVVKAEPVPNYTVPVTAFLKKIRGKDKIETLSHTDNLTLQKDNSVDGGTSRLFYAVHQCFAKHLPLALSPEVLLYTVLHEIAVTVKAYPESYRHLFSKDSGKQLIKVRHDGLQLGNPQSPWHEVMPMFEAALGKVLPSSVLEHAVPDFSTHTPITRAASMVAFMDMASPYYDYRVETLCGIPKIRLLGTPEDYAKLSESCVELAALFSEHLSDYFEHLLPVVNKIAEQAHGFEYDNDFWSSIYKHLSGSGNDSMTGWLTAFLNYTVEGDNTFVPKNAQYYDWKAGMNLTGWGRGYDRSAIPSHVSSVPFIWEYLGTEIPMSFLGGVLSITNVDGYVTPGLGFAVLNKGE
jgi:hypothetical protein